MIHLVSPNHKCHRYLIILLKIIGNSNRNREWYVSFLQTMNFYFSLMINLTKKIWEVWKYLQQMLFLYLTDNKVKEMKIINPLFQNNHKNQVKKVISPKTKLTTKLWNPFSKGCKTLSDRLYIQIMYLIISNRFD